MTDIPPYMTPELPDEPSHQCFHCIVSDALSQHIEANPACSPMIFVREALLLICEATITLAGDDVPPDIIFQSLLRALATQYTGAAIKLGKAVSNAEYKPTTKH